MRWKAARNPGILLKFPCTDSFTPGPYPGLWQRNSSLGVARDVQGETEIGDYRARTGGTAAIVLVLSPVVTQPAGSQALFLLC